MEPTVRIDELVARGIVPPGWTPGVRRRYAKFVRRFCALVLDVLICTGAQIVVWVVTIAAGVPTLGLSEGLVFLLYFGLLDATGGTLGKRAFEIRAVDAAGRAPGLRRGFLRHPWVALYTLAGLLPSVGGLAGSFEVVLGSLLIGLLVPIGCLVGSVVDGLWMLDDPERQTLHDKLAGTYVVEV
jgi:uncharacterized RDD family membrane protein YckC